MKDIDMLIDEDIKNIQERCVHLTPISTLVRAICMDTVWSISQGSDLDATCDQPLKLITAFPMGFWQCAGKEQLMTLSFQPPNFPRIHHRQNILSPERLIHLWMKKMDKFRWMIPWYFTQLSWKPFSVFSSYNAMSSGPMKATFKITVLELKQKANLN